MNRKESFRAMIEYGLADVTAEDMGLDESTERLTLYTTAPRAYDGFSAEEVCPDAGTDHHGRVFRAVSLERRDLEWQTSRYASGMYAWATEADAKRFPVLWRLNETD